MHDGVVKRISSAGLTPPTARCCGKSHLGYDDS